MNTNGSNTAAIEIDLLLEAIYRRYGYDFRSYARASIERRIHQFASNVGSDSIAAMIPRVLHDEEFFSDIVQYFSVGVTELFRDPHVYRTLRETVLPVLCTWPHIKIWCAGCATGEEVYSLAIVLAEEELLDRCQLYATDFNDASLARARQGVYAAEKMQDATRRYQQSGGTGSFSDYYHARYGGVVLDPALRERITFANHNLVSDASFGEIHLILCRNVLIYFDRSLQDRALGLFTESLVHGGFLCLGTKEDLTFSAVFNSYETVHRNTRIYKKKQE